SNKRLKVPDADRGNRSAVRWRARTIVQARLRWRASRPPLKCDPLGGTQPYSSVQILRGVVSSRFGAAAPNLRTVEALLLKRTGLPSMAPGTLNVTIPSSYIVRADATIEPKEYFTGERIKLQRCRVRGHRMIIMRPDSHEM